MAKITTQATNKAVDLADTSIDSALDVVSRAADAAQTAATAPINIAGQTVDVVLEEARKLKASLVDLLRSITDAVTEHLP